MLRKLLLLISGCLAGITVFAQQSAKKYISTKEAFVLNAANLQHQEFLIFPEVRENPIQWLDSLRQAWITNNYSVTPFILHAQPGEYFVFQTGVWAIHQDLKNVQVRFSDLRNEHGKIIAAKEITCFNAGGTNYLGDPFTKKINVQAGQVQALWIGINLPETANGNYSGKVIITDDHVSQTINIRLNVRGKVLTNHGFDEGKRLSRLAWLNSTVGLNNQITKGYIPVSRSGHTIKILGRTMKIADDGLPEAVTTYFTPSNQSISNHGEPILGRPFHFSIVGQDGDIIQLKPGKLIFTSQSPSFITWKVVNISNDVNLICNGRMEYDGFVDYRLIVKAKKRIHIKDIRLEVAMNKDKAVYMMGLNKA